MLRKLCMLRNKMLRKMLRKMLPKTPSKMRKFLHMQCKRWPKKTLHYKRTKTIPARKKLSDEKTIPARKKL
jgi:hypothetical protein